MLSFKFKIPGIILIMAGIVLTILYFLHRVELKVPVFAIYSAYLETKLFAITTTNILDEIILICFLTGFLFTAFSRERIELDAYRELRGNAWRTAVLSNASLLIFCTLFLFGKGFLAILIFNLFSTFLIYHVVFFISKRKYQRKSS